MRILEKFFVIICFFVLSSPAIGDINWEMTDTETIDGQKNVIKQKIFISSDKFAIENDNGEKIILNFEINTLFYVNNAEKNCFSAPLDKIGKATKGIDNETKKLIDEATKDMPAEQREQYKKMMEEKIRSRADSSGTTNAFFPDQSEFKATGKTEIILGYKTKEYVAKDKNGYTYDIWCADEINPTSLLDLYKKIETSGLSKKINFKNTIVPMGFPLKFSKSDGKQSYRSVITSINTKPADSSIFDVPKGFKMKDSGL